MNIYILIGIIIQAVIARASRIAGAVVGYIITTSVLVWGLSIYSKGGAITWFDVKLSQPVFIIGCLVWYAVDTISFARARKHAAFTDQLSGTSPSTGGAVVTPETVKIGEETAGNVVIVVSWKGLGMISDVDVFVTLDGSPAGSGSFVQGFELTLPTTEGEHEIGVKASFRSTAVTLNTESNSSYRVDLQYSRMSGKFKLKSSEIEGEVL